MRFREGILVHACERGDSEKEPEKRGNSDQGLAHPNHVAEEHRVRLQLVLRDYGQ